MHIVAHEHGKSKSSCRGKLPQSNPIVKYGESRGATRHWHKRPPPSGERHLSPNVAKKRGRPKKSRRPETRTERNRPDNADPPALVLRNAHFDSLRIPGATIRDEALRARSLFEGTWNPSSRGPSPRLPRRRGSVCAQVPRGPTSSVSTTSKPRRLLLKRSCHRIHVDDHHRESPRSNDFQGHSPQLRTRRPNLSSPGVTSTPAATTPGA